MSKMSILSFPPLSAIWIHESIHYIFARALGMRAERQTLRVLVNHKGHPPWRVLLALLAPSGIGLAAFLFCLRGSRIRAHSSFEKLLWLYGTWLGFWCAVLGIGDIDCAWYFVRRRRWPESYLAKGKSNG